MLSLFLATLNPMLMMFCCIVLGYLLQKAKVLPENAATVLSRLETYVLVPALMIHTFTTYCTPESLARHGGMMLSSLGIAVLAVLLSYPLSALFAPQGYTRNVYRYAVTFANAGFMGNAVVPAVLGEERLYPYLLFCLPIQLFMYTWGVSGLIPRKEGSSPLRALLKNPTVLSIGAGILLGLSGARNVLPPFFLNTAQSLKACMGPVAMLLTGMVVAGYRAKGLIAKPKVYAASALRLLLLPSLFLALLLLCRADELSLKLCLFAYATPLGLNTVVYPAASGEDTSTGASMALISHSLCVITLPLMASLLQGLLSGS